MGSLCKSMMEKVCNNFEVSIDEIFSTRRYEKIVNAKKVIYYVLRKSGLSFNQISRIVNKDHQTIMRGIATIPQEYLPYADYISKQYKDWKQAEKEEQNNLLLEKERQHILELLNAGESINNIALNINKSKSYTEQQILRHFERKILPDYKKNAQFIKYFEKNKKNY